jgi:hypothetical protein
MHPVDSVRSPATAARRRAAACAFLLVAGLLAMGACSGRAGTTHSQGSGPTTTARRGVDGIGGADATGQAAVTSAPVPPRCPATGLAIAAHDGGAGAGHRSVVLVLTNVTTGPCRLYGYPGVAGLDAAGKQIVQAARTPHGYLGGLSDGAPIPTVDIGAGQAASAMVEATAAKPDGSSCTPYAGLLVTPPDEKKSTRVPWPGDGCDALQIHPVVAGVTGSA